MFQTVHIDWKHILSRVRVTVRPSNLFIHEKQPKACWIWRSINKIIIIIKNIANTESPAWMYMWMKQRPAIVRRSVARSPARERTWAATTAIIKLVGLAESYWAKTGKCNNVKTATTRDYTFTAWKIWSRNDYVAYSFINSFISG